MNQDDRDVIDELPGFLQEVARATSIRVALILVQEFGGLHPLYIPKNPHGSVLAHAVGLEAAAALAQRFGGQRYEIPRHVGQPKKRRIIEANGTHAEVAKRFQVSVRYVRRVRRRRRPDPRQTTFLDD